MRTFERYFIHFFSISIILLLIYLILLKVDKSELLTPIFVLTMFGCTILFSVPMTFIFSNIAKTKTIEIKSENVFEDEKNIHNLITTRLKRDCVYQDSTKRIYKMKNKYNAWLTNPIIVVQKENELIVVLPKTYLEEFQLRFTNCQIIN